MRTILLGLVLIGYTFISEAQVRNDSELKIEDIMKGEDFVGSSPGSPQWSLDSKSVYFNWNPDNEEISSRYKYDVASGAVTRVSFEEQKDLPSPYGVYNRSRDKYLFGRSGDIFITDLKAGTTLQVTNTIERESGATWNNDESKIIYQKDQNLFAWDVSSGSVKQLTYFSKGSAPKEKKLSEQSSWLREDQMAMFEVLQADERERLAREERNEQLEVERPRKIWTGKKRLSGIEMSPDMSYVTYILRTPVNGSRTNVPHFVTETGYLDIRSARVKVGSPLEKYEFFVYNIELDSVMEVKTDQLPGIRKKADFLKEYASEGEEYQEEYKNDKPVIFSTPNFSEDGKAVITIRSRDNKDRWIVLLDPESAELEVLDHQHDEAWIGGPGISGWGASLGIQGWLSDNRTYYFMSEETGYSHLYTVDTRNGKKKALTKGQFEVLAANLSNDKSSFYLVTSEVDPGERHFYRMPVKGGKMTRITTTEGNNNPTLSPDESSIAVRYSYFNKPWELGIMSNSAGAEMKMITESRTDQFKSYDWRVPELVYFEAEDGAKVRARLYKPENSKKNGAAVIFVHGAGYLQNVHKWWSSYYREYMFHNILTDNGYTVLDIDYRASAGYGRDWRTGIYRFMGGKDLSDQVDGAKFLVDAHGIDRERIGIYGGSYGGFITLMAMFTSPGTFKSGAALRSVTDWAHYNHGYTSNILNTPVEDSIAYRKSSPIYHAEGLEGELLMLHGMVDSNVQFQDIVRLSQRLIELGKDNWELAVFPVEGHGFSTASGWTDEYKRIFKLFQETLNPE